MGAVASLFVGPRLLFRLEMLNSQFPDKCALLVDTSESMSGVHSSYGKAGRSLDLAATGSFDDWLKKEKPDDPTGD